MDLKPLLLYIVLTVGCVYGKPPPTPPVVNSPIPAGALNPEWVPWVALPLLVAGAVIAWRK